MHKIWVTNGLVLGKRGVGEANTLVSVLTEELGLVRAAARSTRVEKSKLRYGLETFTTGRFSLVRGRHEWRLVGVEAPHNLLGGISPARRAALGRVTKLLARLIHGEEPVPALYALVIEGFTCLVRAGEEAEADAVECLLVLRVLASLGYLPHTPDMVPFLEADFFSLTLRSEVERSRRMLIRTINESLSATGL